MWKIEDNIKYVINDYVNILKVDIIPRRHLKNIGHKVILHRRVHLNYVASLAPHVQVVDRRSS